jgi:hypothetical protein
VTHYQCLGRKDKRVSFGNHVSYINLFVTGVSSDSLYRIEAVLEGLVMEVGAVGLR